MLNWNLKIIMQSIPSQKALFFNRLAQTNPIPLALDVARAEGAYIYDNQGKKYLDLISGISVSTLGHNHPKVKEAIHKQVDDHLHVMVYGEFVQSKQVEYADYLAQKLPNGLECVYFTNSGAEATEGAMKLAKRLTTRSKVVSFINSYHGSSHGALSIAGGEWLKEAYRPLLPNCVQIEYGTEEGFYEIDENTACVVVEPLQAEGGTVVPSGNFLHNLRQRCDDVGALLIFDEIQTGFGRLGEWFGAIKYAVTPDIMLLGKALGGGMPLGAFVSSKEKMAAFQENPVLGHITTFGGHPVCCAAGLAMAQQIEEQDLIRRVSEIEGRFKAGVKAKVNGQGLLMSVELGSFEKVEKMVKHCILNGVITDWFLFNEVSIRVSPPMIISNEELDLAIKVINNALDEV